MFCDRWSFPVCSTGQADGPNRAYPFLTGIGLGQVLRLVATGAIAGDGLASFEGAEWSGEVAALAASERRFF